jgi:hypothetical protein
MKTNAAYSAPLSTFLADLENNCLFRRIAEGYFVVARRQPPKSEAWSWQTSLPRLQGALSRLPGDVWVCIEERMPIGGPRADVILCGHDEAGRAHAVVIELKAWSEVSAVGNGNFMVPGLGPVEEHPAQQAADYCECLRDYALAFQGPGAILVDGCAYCFNLDAGTAPPLFDKEFERLRAATPLFDMTSAPAFSAYLQERLRGGAGDRVRTSIDQAGIGPSRSLLQHADAVVHGQRFFKLLPEQGAIQNDILGAIRRGSKSSKKHVIVVRGGPGTGKSVIALNAFARALPDLADKTLIGLVSGSGAFTHSLRRILGKRLKSNLKFTDAFWNKDGCRS